MQILCPVKKWIFLIPYIISLSCYSQRWIQQNSNTTTPLYDCYFIDKNIGWVVGNAGTILKTTNGGQSWITQNSGVNVGLRGVYFLDSLNGFAVGGCQTLLRTKNGGVHWQILRNSTNCNITYQSIYMKDSLNGYIGTNQNTNTILQTNKGWNSPEIEDVRSDFGGGINFFQKENLSQGKILSTCTSNKMYFLTSNQGWQSFAVNLSSTLRCGTFLGNSPIYSLYNGDIYRLNTKISSVVGITSSMIFTNQQTGYLASFTGNIYKTTDGGFTWVNENTHITTVLNKLFSVNDTTIWCVGANGVILKMRQCKSPDKPIITTNSSYGLCAWDTIILSSTPSTGYRWYINGVNRTMDTNQSIVATHPGRYVLTVSNGCNTTVSDTVTIIQHLTPQTLKIYHDIQRDTLLAVSTYGVFLSYQWLLNDKIIPDAIKQNYKPIVSGLYTVIGIDTNGCKSLISEPFEYVKTGLNEIKNHSSIVSLTPNPSTGMFQLKNNSENPCEIRIYDLTGKVIDNILLSEKENREMNYNHLSKGLYILNIISDQKYQNLRFIINH